MVLHYLQLLRRLVYYIQIYLKEVNNVFRIKRENCRGLAISLSEVENKLDEAYNLKKTSIRESFVNKIKKILNTKQETVKLLTQSLEKIEEQRSTEQEELEAAQIKLNELEGEIKL